jgi:glycosyltransferase involved in cell wall biosynthesis
VKFVFDHHDLAEEMYLTRGGSRKVADVLRFFERLSCKVADQIITTNESYRRIDIEKHGAQPEKITIVRNGPLEEMLRPVEADANWKDRAPFLIGYLGEIGVNDGVECLIRSLDHLRRLRKDWFCVIIGDGPARVDAEKLMVAMQLADCVAFVGWKQRSEFLKLLSAMDIGVEPIPKNSYTNYSTMIKITEYMAVGLPVVAFDLDEHRFTAGDCALYAQPNDESDFAACLATLMDDAARRNSMSQIARTRIQQLTWQSQEANLRQVYENLGTKRVAE